MPPTSTEQALELSAYLEASTQQYEACLDCLDEEDAWDSPQATVRFQHLRFDENGEPKFNDLAEALADHIIEYCFAARRRGSPKKPYEFSRLSREGRAYLRKIGTSGEAGEMLLYFLLEAVLGAPQMVAKMELKTNPRMELHGSDGIHMKWHESDGKLDLFFGEAKLEQTIYSALDNMIGSLQSFHSERLLEHEFGVVTSHYKHADDQMKAEILKLLDRKQPGGDCRINHACLVGYDWHEYQKLGSVSTAELADTFRQRYISDLPRLKKLLTGRFAAFANRRLRFEIFVLPFRTVQEFRTAFNDAVTG
ncbi:MAG TPA: DUF1837 domain-containing protein [Chthoniobacterales bacterium]|jgi:hypothetical protein